MSFQVNQHLTPTNKQLDNSQNQSILQVHELNNQAKQLLETNLGHVWIEGEISNLAKPRSGHIYLTLKDDQAQVKAAFFKQSQRGLATELTDGLQVLVKAKVSLYAPRGDYQLIISHIEPAGAGRLQQAFDQLKQKLSEAGWFDVEHKKALPPYPAKIGIITSPSGAALQDIINVLARRFPIAQIIVYPCLVQGNEAANQIAKAIQTANQRKEVDLLIVGRGGGSLEDLWPFNEEIVAQQIRYSSLPIVSAVGHQTDVTIADFVADVRAPTPSAAAELVTPDWQELLALYQGYEYQLKQAILRKVNQYKQQLNALARHIRHPTNQIQEQAQRLDQLELRLQKSIQRRIIQHHQTLKSLKNRLQVQHPRKALGQHQQQINQLKKTLAAQIHLSLKRHKTSLDHLSRRLMGMSPDKTLERGYVIAQNKAGTVIDKASLLQPQDQLQLRFLDGKVTVTVS